MRKKRSQGAGDGSQILTLARCLLIPDSCPLLPTTYVDVQCANVRDIPPGCSRIAQFPRGPKLREICAKTSRTLRDFNLT